MSLTQEQVDFENWISDMDCEIAPNHRTTLRRCGNRYEAIDVELAWQAWMEAIRRERSVKKRVSQ